MPPISDLDPPAQVLESLFIHAWELFDDLKHDEAFRLCHELLVEPRLGDFHRAGLHMILGQSPDDYIWHADEAVRMYEILSSHDLTPEQAEGQKELLENAKAVQAKARADKEELDANPATEDEKRRWLENQISDDEPEVEDDDEEDDDEEDDDEEDDDEEDDDEEDDDEEDDDEEDDDEEEDEENDDEEMLDVADKGEAEVKMVYGSAWDPETRMMTPRREEAPARAENEAFQVTGGQEGSR
ncbi:hypothetical protein Q7P36_010669 [Cladosporium allicinum]